MYIHDGCKMMRHRGDSVCYGFMSDLMPVFRSRRNRKNVAKLQRRDRKISDMLKKGRSHDHIAKELMISPSEVVSSIKRLEKHGIIFDNERSASSHSQGA